MFIDHDLCLMVPSLTSRVVPDSQRFHFRSSFYPARKWRSQTQGFPPARDSYWIRHHQGEILRLRPLTALQERHVDYKSPATTQYINVNDQPLRIIQKLNNGIKSTVKTASVQTKASDCWKLNTFSAVSDLET